MNGTQQDILANSILTLFECVLMVVGALFLSWLGSKATSARWPYGKVMWSALAIGLAGIGLGMALSAFGDLIEGLGSGGWMHRASLIVFQIGAIVTCVSASWWQLLQMRYPLDPSKPVNIGRDITFESLLIALTIGYTVFEVIDWTSSFMVAIGAFFASFLLTLIITAFVLDRVFRQRRTRG